MDTKLISTIEPTIADVKLRQLEEHSDARGKLSEIYRGSWGHGDFVPIQWNLVKSGANVLRGVHLHLAHDDHLTVISGELLLGLHDARPKSLTHGRAQLISLQAKRRCLVHIPCGVAHGFYFPRPTIYVYGVSREFDGEDEYGCRWDDPQLTIDWPCKAPLLSDRDDSAGSLNQMLDEAGIA